MKRLVCIGDSITAGQHLPPELAWPALLHGYDVCAAGVPGDTTRLALERFPRDVQNAEPDLVVIQFGQNDANRWQTDRGLPRVSERAFAANVAEMVDRCRTFGAVPYLCSITPSTRSPRHAEDCRTYGAILEGVARECGVEVIDVGAGFAADFLMPDGIHLTPAGHRHYARAVQRALP